MWKKARTLGRGSFGLVSLAISQPNNESKLNLPSLMAVKSAETFQHHSLQKESNLLTELNDCPNILRCYGSFISNDDDNNSVEPIRNFFAALFLANIGMLIDVHFLWNHIDILLAAVILVIVIKTLVVATVVKGFRYNNKTSLLVGMSLAQIGEFAFVLLSLASNVHLVEGKLYLPLLGTTALSLNVGAISDLSGKARLFLVLPVALLDAFFILWIFTSLSATLNKLQYKFFVDGEWRHDEHQPFVSGNYGVVNTVFLAKEPDVIPAIYTPETPGRCSMDVDNDPFFHFLEANYLTKAFVIQVGLVDKNKAVCDFWLVLIFAAIGLLVLIRTRLIF